MDNTAQDSNQNNNLLGNVTSWAKNVDFNQLSEPVKQFGNKVTSRVGNLSTTQKVVGGALLAGGLYYLNNRTKSGLLRKKATR